MGGSSRKIARHFLPNSAVCQGKTENEFRKHPSPKYRNLSTGDNRERTLPLRKALRNLMVSDQLSELPTVVLAFAR